MIVRTLILIVLADLYTWLHEMPIHFGALVTACVGLTVVDIILSKILNVRR